MYLMNLILLLIYIFFYKIFYTNVLLAMKLRKDSAATHTSSEFRNNLSKSTIFPFVTNRCSKHVRTIKLHGKLL